MSQSSLRLILPLSLVGLFAFSACKERRADPLEGEARKLFARSSAMIRAYTDSMAAVRDSASWARLDHDFDRRLARLNFEFPADTDLRMTEGENDTLSSLTHRYVEVRTEAIERILHPKPVVTDSVSE